MRWTRRRNDATERSRTSSALSAVVSVRRPRCFGAPARGRLDGGGAGRTGAPPTPRRAGRRSSSSASGVIVRAIGGRRDDLGLFFLAAEALLGDLVGLALGLLVVAAAILLGALARFGGLALGAFDRVALGADLRLFLGDLAFLGLAHLGVAERVRAPVLLFLGERAQQNAGRLRRRRWTGAGACCAGAPPRCTTPPRRGSSRRDRARAPAPARAPWLRPVRARRLHLLDHHRLGAAVAEALPHHAGLGARLERQRLGRADAQRLLARAFGISSHSHPILNVSASHRKSLAARFPAPRPSGSTVRKRSRLWQRARNPLLAGPASRAACTTFDRPNAKSNCADRKRRDDRDFARISVRLAPGHGRRDLAGPVGGPVRGLQDRRPPARRPARFRSGQSPIATRPALWAMPSASSAARSSWRSTSRRRDRLRRAPRA